MTAVALDVAPSAVLAVLRRRAGKALTTDDILTSLKEALVPWDNHAAVIWAATRLEDTGKVVAGYTEVAGRRRCTWMVEKPKEKTDGSGR